MDIGLNKAEAAGMGGMCAQTEIVEASTARKAMLVGLLLIILQALDGVLTSLGVSRYGIAAEGNPILRWLMLHFGHVQILSVVKVIAILFVITLSYYARKLPWVHNAMGAISCIYVFTAILPWTYILFFQPH